MKHLIVLCSLLTAASTCHATSNVVFTGEAYVISVVLSDEACKVSGFNVSGNNQNIISIGANDLTAFAKAECNYRKQTIHLVLPATESHPYFELKSSSKNGHMILGKTKMKVSPDWQM